MPSAKRWFVILTPPLLMVPLLLSRVCVRISYRNMLKRHGRADTPDEHQLICNNTARITFSYNTAICPHLLYTKKPFRFQRLFSGKVFWGIGLISLATKSTWFQKYYTKHCANSGFLLVCCVSGNVSPLAY